MLSKFQDAFDSYLDGRLVLILLPAAHAKKLHAGSELFSVTKGVPNDVRIVIYLFDYFVVYNN